MSAYDAIASIAEPRIKPDVEETIVIILERDGSLSYYPPQSQRKRRAQTTLTAATPDNVPSVTLIERIMRIAFDIAGVHRLEVRIDES
ncbi:hypothetical protein [Chloroflexus sp.]|uniref:hypothetical protein n=1 Tax=Chloroflexus sp. TaxID=1904827 RepID=UPI002ADD7997|nr:hypothetical protein [Chloroflexus sp.]